MLVQPWSKPFKFKRIVSNLENAVTVQPWQQWRASVSWTALNIDVPWILISVYKYVSQADSWVSAQWRLWPSSRTTVTIDWETLLIPTNRYAYTTYWYWNPAYGYSDQTFWDYNSLYNRASNGWVLSFAQLQTYAWPGQANPTWDNFPAYYWITCNTSSLYNVNSRLNIPFQTLTISHTAESFYIWNPSSANHVAIQSYLVIEYAIQE